MFKIFLSFLLASITLKAISIELASIDISLYRLLLFPFIGLMMAALIINSDLRRRFKSYFLIGINSYLLLIFLLSTISFIISYSYHVESIFSLRIIIGYISFISYFVLFPIVFILAFNNRNSFNQVVLHSSKILYGCLLFGVAQVFLDLAGITISFEALTEFTEGNKSLWFGTAILRPNSFFGEPRDLASLVIPIMIFYRFIRLEYSLKKIDYFLILFLGIISASITFILVLGLCVFLYIFFSKTNLIKIVMLIFIFLLIIPFSLYFSDIQLFIEEQLPRFLILFTLTDITEASANSDLFVQATDILLGIYLFDIVSMKISVLNSLFGYGLGSGIIIVGDYMVSMFGSYLPENSVFNTRILAFTWLIEFGLVGCGLMILWVHRLIKIFCTINNLKIRKISFLVYLSIGCCMLSQSYFFVALIMYLMAANIKFKDEQLN